MDLTADVSLPPGVVLRRRNARQQSRGQACTCVDVMRERAEHVSREIRVERFTRYALHDVAKDDRAESL